MNKITALIFLLALNACVSTPPPTTQTSEQEKELIAAQAELGATYMAVSSHLADYGLSDSEWATTVPQYLTQVTLFGETSPKTIASLAMTRSVADLLNGVKATVLNASASKMSAPEVLLSVASADQKIFALDQSEIRFDFAELAYEVEKIRCLSKFNATNDLISCSLRSDFAIKEQGVKIADIITNNMIGDVTTQDQSAMVLVDAVRALVTVFTQNKIEIPQSLSRLQKTTEAGSKLVIERQTQQSSFGDKVKMVRNGVATGAGAAAGAASLIAQATTGGPGSQAIKDLLAIEDLLFALFTVELPKNFTDLVAVSGFNADSLKILASEIQIVVAEVTSGDKLLVAHEAAHTVQQRHAEFVATAFQMQSLILNEKDQFSRISNVLKTKHDTAKNSVGNIR